MLQPNTVPVLFISVSGNLLLRRCKCQYRQNPSKNRNSFYSTSGKLHMAEGELLNTYRYVKLKLYLTLWWAACSWRRVGSSRRAPPATKPLCWNNENIYRKFFLVFYVLHFKFQQSYICRLSDSTVSEDVGIELSTVARLWHWPSYALTTPLGLILARLALIHFSYFSM